MTKKKKKSRFKKKQEEESGVVLTVSWGRRNEVLGTVIVPESSSYEDARKLVRPLIAEYFGRLEQSALGQDPSLFFTDGISDKIDNFNMCGPDGYPMTRDAEQVIL